MPLNVAVDKRIDLPAVDRHEVVTIRTQLDVRAVHGPTDRHPFAPQPGHHPRFVLHGQTSSDKGGNPVARRTSGVDHSIDLQPPPVGQRDLAGLAISKGYADHGAPDPQFGSEVLGVSGKAVDE